ncbi:DNA-binding response regulator, OmpR family, contains REC and winged-helix (wHTH) domain [Caloranaerobacter azorensis DSM 13643]|uniref:DNA-binding response regulator, OmpR family, contains REC and winged-helix (WHTH) domain n=1 Tax=Caloranaerobacter azorensis DSM 13643 TaxID=1121264 RepID=A0A1M5TKG3_9FIRM|nr:response regulator transcription factor [Caloranaerobacter azorensis]SHH51257.1 DNA-binding response regulator, OmpR family, contains REC and winged-helix (wHTH) domain [Caloranaerobacter azorensis DSM 13643]
MRKVLVLEDKTEIRQFIVINLKRAGFHVIEASTGEDALEILNNEEVDIAVLDVMLPGIDGFEVCRKIRQKDETIGVIMLTAKTQEMDKINGLMLGADDYVVKPFSPSELVARIDALYRRIDMIKRKPKNEIICGPFKLDFKQRRLFKKGKPIDITQTEFAIMKLFLENQGEALSRDYILDKVWGKNYFGSIKVVDVNIRRLRQKIEDNPSEPRFIETVWGYGYRWKKDECVEGN